MYATTAATAVATMTAISSSTLLRISCSSCSSVATTIHLLKCSSFVGGNPVCCPQINREGNNNTCWQSVSSVVGGVNVRCSTSSSDRRVGFLGRLGRVFKEKAKSDIQLLFSGFSKTRENLAVVDELLTYWNLSDSENILDELEEVQCFSFLCCFFSSLACLLTGCCCCCCRLCRCSPRKKTLCSTEKYLAGTLDSLLASILCEHNNL